MSTTDDTTAPAVLASGSSAEAQAAAFANDPRVHFDKAANTWRFEQDDSTELEYDAAKGAWIALVRRPNPPLQQRRKLIWRTCYSGGRRPSEGPTGCVLCSWRR